MNSQDKERIINRYNHRLDKFGEDIATMASGTEDRRELRFRVMTEIGIENGDRILDLGSGFGDFFRYLQKNQIDVDYTGYDINPALVEIAQKRNPNCKFEVKNILHDDYPLFDYIVSTSSFNLPLEFEDNYSFISTLLGSCYQHAKKAVSVDFLSSYVDFESVDGFHYEPEKIFKISKSITKRVKLRHDYPLFEFAVYLFKDFEGWSTQRQVVN